MAGARVRGAVMVAALCVRALPTLAAEALPAPTAPGRAPDAEEVDAVLRELERNSNTSPLPLPSMGPAAEPSAWPTAHPPTWMEQVTPVMQLRLRPFLQLGHPTSQRRPALLMDLKTALGAQVYAGYGVTARVVANAALSFPNLRAPGLETLQDAWLDWAYPALGGEMSIKVGRQALVLGELLFAPNTWLQRPPRFDGVVARVTSAHWFFTGALVVEALNTLPAAGAAPPVTVLGAVQSGVQDGEGRQVEVHAVMVAPGLGVNGDKSEGVGGRARLYTGGHAQWEWKGLHARGAVDLAQQRFDPPSMYAPPLAFHGEAGFAPPWEWAFGSFAEAGARGAMGQPMKYLPGRLGNLGVWGHIPPQAFEPLYGTAHGSMGEMDLLSLNNGWAVFARVGLHQDRIKQLSLTVWRLAQWDATAAWTGAQENVTYLAAGEGRPNGLIGHEADLTASAQLTPQLSLQGAVGVLYSGPRARDAQFAQLAQTAYTAVEWHW